VTLRAKDKPVIANRIIVLGRLLLIVTLLQAYDLGTYGTPRPQATSTLQEFFQRLVDHYSPGSLPKFDELMRVEEQIAGLHSEEVTKALPVVFTALGRQDVEVKIYASSAIFAVSLRPDSALLLRKYVTAISDLLNESDPRLQAISTLIFLNMKPKPLAESLPSLVNFLRRTDRDQDAQGSAVFALVRIAPENPEVLSAIQQFLARDLDYKSRIGVLNALGSPGFKDVRIVSVVIAEMDDSDQGMRITAIQSITRMGKDAVRQARPTLQRLSEDPKQTAEVRAAAAGALLQIQAPNH
jgi:Lipoprotein amino terminal region